MTRLRIGLTGAALAAFGLVAAACQPVGAVAVPGAEGCTVMPANSFWRADVRGLPVRPESATWIGTAGATSALKADFGAGLWDGGPIGIPYDVVPGTQPKVAVNFTAYGDESDPGPYPIPPNAQIEGGAASGGDRHVIVVDKDNCTLYETYSSYPAADGTWNVMGGVRYDLSSNAMRPAGWTSADAAGLPILPGLVRYEEVASGTVSHAIRMTVPATAGSYVWPASHRAGSANIATTMPMGAWLRLKAAVDENQFDPSVRPIVVALKIHGAVIADNGSPWFMSGAPDDRWNNDQLQTLRRLRGTDFEVVDSSSLQVAPNSYQATTAG